MLSSMLWCTTSLTPRINAESPQMYKLTFMLMHPLMSLYLCKNDVAAVGS